MQNIVLKKIPEGGLWQAMIQSAHRYGWLHQVMQDMHGDDWSYQRLCKQALHWRALWDGDSKCHTYGLLLPSHPNSLSVILAAWSQGRSVALLNITSGVAGIQAACNVAGLTTIVSSRAFLATVGADTLPSVLIDVNWRYLEDLAVNDVDIDMQALPCIAIHPDDEAVVLFTSGSEGLPKGVSLSHRNLFVNIEQTCAVLEFLPSDRFFIALPLFHSFGLTVGCLLPLIKGIPVVLFPSPLLVKQIPKAIAACGCTVLFGSSSFLSQWGRNAEASDLATLRYVIAGAEKLQSSVRDYWKEKFSIDILEGYGVTETSPVIAVNTLMFNKIGSVGRVVPEMSVTLAPVEGFMDGGRLHVAGPNVMRGYYLATHPGVLSEVPSQLGTPWYDTGDLARLDADGTLVILGRQKRFAKVGGEMVSLAVTEGMAQLLDAEGQHAAVAVSDANRGERIVLITTNDQLSRRQFVEVAKRCQLPEVALPRSFVVVAQLPLLASGKLDLTALSLLAERA